MSKHVIIERYTFNPSTRTVTVIGKNMRREQLMLITNTTSDIVIYNFSDPALLATAYTNEVSSTTGLETTTIVLAYNTSGMNANDKISILYEESYYELIPSETYRDPVDKLRVSEPKALIDTDFEYGLQPTKWESVATINQRPSTFYDPGQGISNISSVPTFAGASGAYQITNVTASGNLVTVAINNTTGITVGTPIFIQGTLDQANADGYWLVESVATNTNITYSTVVAPNAASLFDTNKTYLFINQFYSQSNIPTGLGCITLNGTRATVTTTDAHGLRVGNYIFIRNTTGATGRLNSTWVVETTPTVNTFTFLCAATGTPTTPGNTVLTPAIHGYIEHRAFDGGVQSSNQDGSHGNNIVRQSRRQFRYQSGKAIQFSTGSCMRPQFLTNSITASGTTVTVTCRQSHGMGVGGFISVSGCVETAYNGNFVVTGVPSAYVFTYTALTTPSASPATGSYIVNPFSWFGSYIRIGMFDTQNGAFFEYDGQAINVVRRNSTTQGSGSVTVTQNSPTVTGSNTRFNQEYTPGDLIIIRGMSYYVQSIQSATSMQIYPEFRGVSGINCNHARTIDTKFGQPDWNIDRCDGTGASLYNLNLGRIQMFYMDYSWYGAGAIRFGFKNNRGEVIYCHRIVNNNINTEAYWRSGNLPARYETNSAPTYTRLAATLNSGDTGAMTVVSTAGFATAGTLVVSGSAATGAPIEYISYNGVTATQFTGLTRTRPGGNAVAQTFTFSATAPCRVEPYSPQCAPAINHWGSSVIMDGGFDDDKSFIFVAGMQTAITNIGAGVIQPLLSIRVAPTVDSGLVGVLGVREVVNRMQLVLRQADVYTTGGGGGGGAMTFLITGRLNGRVSGGTFVNLGGGSLSQIAFHTSGQTISGGDPIFGFFTTTPGVTTSDLSGVRDLGTSILGGGLNNNVPNTDQNKYPDGPDVLTLVAQNITSTTTNSINARLGWTESQA
jgi:hypothetical protein